MTQLQIEAHRGGKPYFCVQEITDETIAAGESNTFYCYNTMNAADHEYREMLPRINEWFARNRAISPRTEGHWAVYWNVACNNLISDVYVCSGGVSNKTIYSLTNWYGPTFSLLVRNASGGAFIYSQGQSAYWLTTPYVSAYSYNAGCA